MAKMMNREKAARFLGLDPRTVYDRYRAGDIPAVRVGRVLRFDRAQLVAWKKQQTTNEPAFDGIGDSLPLRTTSEQLMQAHVREQRQTNALLRQLVARKG